MNWFCLVFFCCQVFCPTDERGSAFSKKDQIYGQDRFMIHMGQRASCTRASPRLTYHLRICVDADESELPDRWLVCSQPVPSLQQRRSIIHFRPACQHTAAWSVFILACWCSSSITNKRTKTTEKKKKKRKKTSELHQQQPQAFSINTFGTNNQKQCRFC